MLIGKTSRSRSSSGRIVENNTFSVLLDVVMCGVGCDVKYLEQFAPSERVVPLEPSLHPVYHSTEWLVPMRRAKPRRYS